MKRKERKFLKKLNAELEGLEIEREAYQKKLFVSEALDDNGWRFSECTDRIDEIREYISDIKNGEAHIIQDF